MRLELFPEKGAPSPRVLLMTLAGILTVIIGGLVSIGLGLRHLYDQRYNGLELSIVLCETSDLSSCRDLMRSDGITVIVDDSGGYTESNGGVEIPETYDGVSFEIYGSNAIASAEMIPGDCVSCDTAGSPFEQRKRWSAITKDYEWRWVRDRDADDEGRYTIRIMLDPSPRLPDASITFHPRVCSRFTPDGFDPSSCVPTSQLPGVPNDPLECSYAPCGPGVIALTRDGNTITDLRAITYAFVAVLQPTPDGEQTIIVVPHDQPPTYRRSVPTEFLSEKLGQEYWQWQIEVTESTPVPEFDVYWYRSAGSPASASTPSPAGAIDDREPPHSRAGRPVAVATRPRVASCNLLKSPDGAKG